MREVVGTTKYGITASLPVGYMLKTAFGLPRIVGLIVTCIDYQFIYFKVWVDDDAGEYFYICIYTTTKKYVFGDKEYYIPYAYMNIFDDYS